MSYLQGLNEHQKEAVLHTEGPLLIVAGAGAGKTKTITHRIAHIVEKGVPARNILAVTFTNKAAGEMRERVRGLVPQGKGIPLVCTFHSLGVRLLREFHEEAKLPRGFVIWDRDDSVRAIKHILEKMSVEEYTPRSILSAISKEKGDGMSAREYSGRVKNYRERLIAQAWESYEKTLHDEGALDFDDLLLRSLTLLRNSKNTLSLLQNRWTYITIDEYQDTNRSQYEIARLLTGTTQNICVVGDTDQNIYSWRGADIAHLLSFEKTFPNTKTVLLEQNYRSTRSILTAANNVIEKNLRRIPKILRTDNPAGEPIVFYGAQNEMEEAWFIAKTAKELIASGESAGEIAVLYRENFQSRVLEEAMLNQNVPYRVLGTRFFERKEVKDTLSYLRAAMNPKSRNDLSRIVSAPPRGIGKVTLEKMLDGKDDELAPAARAKVQIFRDLLIKIKHAIDTLPVSEAIRYVIEASGMEKSHSGTEEGQERIQNMRELVNLSIKYDNDTPPEGIERLLEEAALQSDQDELDEQIPAVALMTVHASKGLEFGAVFVTGLEQGLFPSMRATEGRDEEEERRLFYVALTRAKRRAYLTYAATRMKYGERDFTVPSEFLSDIDPRLVSTTDTGHGRERVDLID